MKGPHVLATGAIVVGLFTLAPPGHAQSATSLDRLDPSPAGDRFTAVPSPEVLGHLRPLAGLTLVYTDAPLSILRTTATTEREIELVSHQLTLHGSLAMELWHRVKLELTLPMILDQSGDDVQLPTFTGDAPNGAAAGDLRTGLRIEVLRQQGHAPAAAVALSAWLPSGNDDAYAGAGVFRAAPSLVVGADHGPIAWSTHLAARLQPEGNATLLGSELLFGAAVGPRVGPVRIAAEVFGSTVLDRDVATATLAATSVNGLLTATWEDGPVHYRIGGGPGLSTGVGTPDFRVLGAVAYVPSSTTHQERDDAERRAREQATQDRPGADALPPPLESPAPAPGGTTTVVEPTPPPSDADGDGILDAADACREEAGPRSDDPDKNGCPTAVRLVGDRIVILQRVEFATGEDVLEPTSLSVLEQVAAVMAEHPEIARVGVDGHTDGVGRQDANVELSQRRALSVVRWLVDHGVDARRLEARGFGPRQPIADNETEAGRQQNRRVEFNILRRSAQGRAGWLDGDLDDGAPGEPGEKGAPR